MKTIVCLVALSMLAACAGVTRQHAFRDDRDRCFIQVRHGDYLKVEQVGEEFCTYDNVPRKFYIKN